MMKLKNILPLIALALAATGCDETLGTGSLPRASIVVAVDGSEGLELTGQSISFRNVSSQRVSKFDFLEGISLIPGLYDVSYSASFLLPNGAKSILRASQTSVVVPEGSTSLTLKGYSNIETDDLVIAEVFFTGTIQASGNSYNGDQYIKLYNNTDHVIYADGLTLFETKFSTTEKYDYTPDIMATDVTVQALYTIPGDGTEHPVEPGQYFLLADVGIDHRVSNPYSFDLSHADFEWYDESSSPNATDIDSPLVPNLDKWYCYTNTVWILHNRGFKSWGIARIPVSAREYVENYRYEYDFIKVTLIGSFPTTDQAYRLPNEWISDMVTCSIESRYAWQICSPALDSGWAYCGTVDNDKNRYFHSVRRKMMRLNEQGNPVLQDTNNSSDDFNSDVIASEIELQGSVINVQGDRATSITYDGVTPKP